MRQEESGTYLDSGRFSVDWQRLRSVYSPFLNSQPDLYLCKLFQAAVRCRPERLNLDLSMRRFTLSWQTGETFTSELLDNLFQLLQTGAGSPLTAAGRHLAAAGRFLSLRPDLELRLEGSGQALVLDDTGPRRASSTVAGTRIQVWRRSWLPKFSLASLANLRWEAPLTSLMWPEFGDFRQRLGYHPAPLYLNGRQLYPCPPGALACRAQADKDGPIGLDSREKPYFWGAPEGDGGEILRCRAVVSLEPNLGTGNIYTNEIRYRPDVFVLVSDGLKVLTMSDGQVQAGLTVVLDSSSLTTDAGGILPVQNEQWRDFLDTGRQEREHFMLWLEEKLQDYESDPLTDQLHAALRRFRSLPH